MKKKKVSRPREEIEDKRREALEHVERLLKSGAVLSEPEIRETITLARDQVSLQLLRDTIEDKYNEVVWAGSTATPKTVIRMQLFSKLQNAVERHEIMHSDKSDNPLDDLAKAWNAAVERAKSEC